MLYQIEQAREKVLINLPGSKLFIIRSNLGKNIMKNINEYSYKLTIVATSLVMAYFASGIASIAQASELIKAEPVKHIELMQEAKDSLKLSFSTLVINNDFNNSNADSIIAKQKMTVNENKTVTLTKTTLISE